MTLIMTLPTNPITLAILIFCCYVGFQLLRLLIGQCLGMVRDLTLIFTPESYKKSVTNFFFRINIFLWRGKTQTVFEEIDEKYLKIRNKKQLQS